MAARRVVLLIEDDDDLRRLYRQALRLNGYVVHEARGGFEALRQLDTVVPDVIVLDLMLPGIDGRTVRQELAADLRTRDVPILVVTGSAANVDDLDVACLLRKPASPSELVAAVGACVETSGKQPT